MEPEKDAREFGVAVGRIQSDVMHVLSTLTEMKTAQKDDYNKLDSRITALEKFMWKIAGISLLFPFGFTAALWVLGRL